MKSLHADQSLAWTTVSKIRGVMLRVYKVGLLHELCTRNPAQAVETRSKTDYRAIVLTPQQTLAIIRALPNILHRILVLTLCRDRASLFRAALAALGGRQVG